MRKTLSFLLCLLLAHPARGAKDAVMCRGLGSAKAGFPPFAANWAIDTEYAILLQAAVSPGCFFLYREKFCVGFFPVFRYNVDGTEDAYAAFSADSEKKERMKMHATGKYITVACEGIKYDLCNQRCRDWDHPYAYQRGGETLSDAGCGIFSIAHAACYLGGEKVIPEELADFSCMHGGRGDDGTDRPALLTAMEREGLAKRYGFSYRFDGLRNDLIALHLHLLSGGAALCNLRPGHIVALVGARSVGSERQVLAADPYSESADERVKNAVRECIPGSEVVFPVLNGAETVCGYQVSYAMFWAALSTVRDFNLLHRLNETP